MSKNDSAAWRRTTPTSRRIAALLFLIPLLFACTADGAETTPFPTAIMIPIPETATPTVTPTATPTQTGLLRPGDLHTPTPDTPERRLVQLAREDAATARDVSLASVGLAHIEPRTWRDAQTLDCGLLVSVAPSDNVSGFEIILLAGNRVFVYHTDTEDRLIQCGNMPITEVPGDLLIRFDPIALDLFNVARRDVAESLNVPLSRVRLVDMRLTFWEDSSLGCPRPGVEYAPMRVVGYRIVLTTGTAEYAFHTDSDTLTPCDVAVATGD